MKRSLKDYVSWKAVRHIAYLPRVMIAVTNWPDFLSNYLGFTHRIETYLFRNGTRIKTIAVTDVATILDIFFRKDYGDVRSHTIVVDIGANIGAYAIFAATRSNDTTVFAFEPAPQEFQAMTENIRINGLEKNIIASPSAATGRDETKTIFLNGGPHNSFYEQWEHAPTAEVSCVSLESIFAKNNIERCDMLKMDCEGSEFEILESLSEATFKKIFAIRMEYHCPKGAPMTPNELVAFLAKKGYRIVKREAATEDRGIVWAEKDGRKL